MQVTTSAIVNGEFEDKYGKRGSQFSPNNMPTYSIPFEISGAPEGTKSFAVVLEDKDAITASGFVWTHWLIADLKRTSVAENESLTATDYTQGANSWASPVGQVGHRRSHGLRRHVSAQLPPPLRTHRLRTRHRIKPAARLPLQRPAFRHAGTYLGQRKRNGNI